VLCFLTVALRKRAAEHRMEDNMPLLFWLPIIIVGGMWGTTGGPDGLTRESHANEKPTPADKAHSGQKRSDKWR
jgi:hypothetical protein